ncbi:hypothetical protein [Vreelandella piezotolerans]|uniref:hypothetical protein n=1 Tax=Vreelandella piezotolerans TaxID=2609667 RepID=UPI0014449DF4|nr:hypothetical protein [Halomonas piezotolerans]
MSYRAYFIASLNAIRYIGYGWRFSVARSVLAATSDRAHLGGKLVMRCHALCPTNSES